MNQNHDGKNNLILLNAATSFSTAHVIKAVYNFHPEIQPWNAVSLRGVHLFPLLDRVINAHVELFLLLNDKERSYNIVSENQIQQSSAE